MGFNYYLHQILVHLKGKISSPLIYEKTYIPLIKCQALLKGEDILKMLLKIQVVNTELHSQFIQCIFSKLLKI